MAKKKTTNDLLAELEAKTEKSPEDLKQIEELKLQLEIEKEEAEKKAKEEAGKKAAAELKKKEEAEKKAKEKKTIPLALHQEFATHLFRVNRMKPGKKYKFEASFKELKEKVSKFEGLKAKKNKTICVKGKLFKLTEKYPNPVELGTIIETLHGKELADKIMNDLFEL